MSCINVVGTALNELYRIFDILNEKYYEGKLSPPVITLQKARSNNLGHFTLGKVWRQKEHDEDENLARYEINLNPLYLNAPVEQIVGTLQHEMVHYANAFYGVKDCNGNVHNKKFKALAEEVGLIVEKGKSVGWGFTEPDDTLLKFIRDTIMPDEKAFDYFRGGDREEEKPPKNKTSFKYTCPGCDLVVRAKRDKRIVCGTCGCELEMEEDE
ncbi:MAG: SprT-like domain-containing protein [Enterocloster asparagiformis]|nr:SprT-like domain-containing protein [Enterocloster asparagiformis]